MEFLPSKKDTLYVDAEEKYNSYYLIYDLNYSKSQQNVFKRPESCYIKIFISYKKEQDKYIVGEYGISELSFAGITNSHHFYLYVAISPTKSTKFLKTANTVDFNENQTSSNKKEETLPPPVFAKVHKLNTSKSIIFQIPISSFGLQDFFSNSFDKIPISVLLSIVPFSAPVFKPKLLFLPLLSFSFVNIIPQITEFHSDYPITSWIRQTQYNCDSSVLNLYNYIFPEKEIDLATIYQGLKKDNKNHDIRFDDDQIFCAKDLLYNNSSNIEQISEKNGGLSLMQVKMIVFTITRLICLELGFSYHLFASQPVHSHSVIDDPQILVFSPVFGFKGTVIPEILCNDVMFTLHSVVREEEGNFTSTVYSPFTKIYYDIRNGNIVPINRQRPPLCNPNEVILMMLYVRKELNEYYSRFVRPIAPFFSKYPYINVYECKIGEKVGDAFEKVETAILERDINKFFYYSYNKDYNRYPTYPVEQPCGIALLRFDKSDHLLTKKDKRALIIWECVKQDNKKLAFDFIPRPMKEVFLKEHELKDGYTYAVIQDHCFAAVYSSLNSSFADLDEFRRALPMPNVVFFQNKKLVFDDNTEQVQPLVNRKLVCVCFSPNSTDDKFVRFIGEPIMLLIDVEKHFHGMIEAIKEELGYKFDEANGIFLRSKGSWLQIRNAKEFQNSVKNITRIELLILVKNNITNNLVNIKKT